MKLGPVTKLNKRNIRMSKKIDDDAMSENFDVIVIFQFLANLEQSGGWNSDTESAKLCFQ